MSTTPEHATSAPTLEPPRVGSFFRESWGSNAYSWDGTPSSADAAGDES